MTCCHSKVSFSSWMIFFYIILGFRSYYFTSNTDPVLSQRFQVIFNGKLKKFIFFPTLGFVVHVHEIGQNGF